MSSECYFESQDRPALGFDIILDKKNNFLRFALIQRSNMDIRNKSPTPSLTDGSSETSSSTSDNEDTSTIPYSYGSSSGNGAQFPTENSPYSVSVRSARSNQSQSTDFSLTATSSNMGSPGPRVRYTALEIFNWLLGVPNFLSAVNSGPWGVGGD